jgi:hypothetical protein
MLDGLPIDDSYSKVLHNRLVNSIALERSANDLNSSNKGVQMIVRPILTKSSTVHFVERSTTG